MGKLREQMKIDLELQSSKQVLEYLGRYSHWVAISNHRLIKVEDGKVTLSKSDITGYSATASKDQAQTMSEDFGEYLNH